MIRVEAIVLAAGEGRRMGRSKPLLPWNGRTLIEHIVSELQVAKVQAIHVVTGHRADEVAVVLQGTPAVCVANPDYHDGMLSSVRAGLRAIADDADAVLVCLCDQPHIPPVLVNQLVDAFAAGAGEILVPVVAGRRGHPLLFSIRYRAEILACYDDTGLRGLLQAHPDAVCEVVVDDPGILVDLDTPEDYARATRGGAE